MSNRTAAHTARAAPQKVSHFVGSTTRVAWAGMVGKGGARTGDASVRGTGGSEDNPQDVFQPEPQAESHTVLKSLRAGFGVAGVLPFCSSNTSTPGQPRVLGINASSISQPK